MKILYINSYDPDYLTMLLFHGLISLGHEVIDLNYMDYLDKCNEFKIDRNSLYGKGFSYAFIINKDRANDDRTNIEEKIAQHYFDIIIFSIRNLKYLDLVVEKYKMGEIFVVDGEDWGSINNSLIFDYTNILYFKRELIAPNHGFASYSKIFPINFAIPKEKFQQKNYYKSKFCEKDDYVPYLAYIEESGRKYKFNNEQEYYNHYNDTAFVITGSNGGYDCMRHYEIVASHSLPVYLSWDKVPRGCMTMWPSQLQFEANTLYIDTNFFGKLDNSYFEHKYFKILDEFYDYAYNNLTTEHLAKYLLSFC